MDFVRAPRSPGTILLGSVMTVLMLSGLSTRARAEDSPPLKFENVKWQSATPADMTVFEPYIGTFRSKTQKADDGTEFHFAITYAWFDKSHTVVRFAIETRMPSRNEARPLGEGFYYHEAFLKRLAVVGFFKDGRIGSGFVTPFDTTTHERVVRIHAIQPGGGVAEIRDTFWVIDANSWGNRTLVAMGEEGWHVVSDEVFTRVED